MLIQQPYFLLISLRDVCEILIVTLIDISRIPQVIPTWRRKRELQIPVCIAGYRGLRYSNRCVYMLPTDLILPTRIKNITPVKNLLFEIHGYIKYHVFCFDFELLLRA